MGLRGFMYVDESKNTILPKRQTKNSAGYDFYLTQDVEIAPNEVKKLPTNVKVYMQDDEVLMIFIRSSMGVKNGLVLQNGTGIIDADFFPNEISLVVRNTSTKTVTLSSNCRIAQGIFTKYLVTDDDQCNDIRDGGFGSTDK